MADIAVDAPDRLGKNVISRNPNASIALGSGSGLGALIVWGAGLAGADLPPEIAAVLAGAVASIFLFIGRRGIKGSILQLWNGSQS
jgi:hypothetical protein